MALNITKRITFTGLSKIDGTSVERYSATIDPDNPDNVHISSVQLNKSLYKANREQCRADKAEFEEAVYAMQDEMLKGE